MAKAVTATKKTRVKKNSKGGVREGAGASQLVPDKVRKSVDIPKVEAEKILKGGHNISNYMRKATYNQMVADGYISQKRADQLISWKKKR